MSQKLPVDGFKWVENTIQFNKDFIKSYNEDCDEHIFLKLIFSILKLSINDWAFSLQRMQVEKVQKIVANLHNKKEYVIHIKKLKGSIKSWISLEEK